MRDPNAYAHVTYAHAAHAVGNALYHTTSDRLEAVKSLDDDFTKLYRELAVFCGYDDAFWHPSDAALRDAARAAHKDHPERLVWWKVTAKPIFDSWVAFKTPQTGNDKGDYAAFGERFLTDWPVYEKWHTVLEQLRAGAQGMLGHPLTSAAPSKLPTTVLQDAGGVVANVASTVADKAGDVWTLGKVAIYGGIALGGLILVGSLASNLRSGKDPAASYFALARGRGR